MTKYVAPQREVISRHAEDITRVVQFVGKRGAAELERLTTALYVTERHDEESIEARAKRINELRPHVSVELATEALKELDESPILH